MAQMNGCLRAGGSGWVPSKGRCTERMPRASTRASLHVCEPLAYVVSRSKSTFHKEEIGEPVCVSNRIQEVLSISKGPFLSSSSFDNIVYKQLPRKHIDIPV